MESLKLKQTLLSQLDSEILLTLMYFDLFKHPLRLEEVVTFLRVKVDSKEEVRETLIQLTQNNWIREEKGFYQLDFHKANLVGRRIHSENIAKSYYPKARLFSALIQSFPFTRGVAVSGSLSKGCMYEDGDIDYFIITKSGRLWINRLMLTAFKKVFLLNSKKYFCINYFITEDRLEIPKQNMFTAIEIATLMPFKGNGTFDAFFAQNNWVLEYFPNFNIYNTGELKKYPNWLPKRIAEWTLGGKLGDWLDDSFMNLIRKVKERKFKKQAGASYDVAFKSDKNVSKHHPENRQQKVPKLLKDKIQLFETTYGVKFNLTSKG